MRAVVTGTSGFLGGAVASALAARGADVLGLDLRPDPAAPLDTWRVDLAERGPWQHAVAEADVVVHAAARVGDHGSRAAFERANVRAVRRVLEASATAGHLVHLSSIVVHGRRFPADCPESHPAQPTGNPYTDTKIAGERLVLDAHAEGRVRATVVRPGDVYGPGSEPWTVRPVRMLRAGTFALVDGGRGVLAPVFLRDLVAGVLAAVDAGPLGEAVHLSGPGVPTATFFGHYARRLGVPLRSVPPAVARVGAPLVGAAFRLVGKPPPLSGRTLEYVTHPAAYSVARAARLLGWRPATTLDDGMEHTAAWLRAVGLL